MEVRRAVAGLALIGVALVVVGCGSGGNEVVAGTGITVTAETEPLPDRWPYTNRPSSTTIFPLNPYLHGQDRTPQSSSSSVHRRAAAVRSPANKLASSTWRLSTIQTQFGT
ncbi:hypothetical protein BDB13_6008 [Rhodococcus sp. OK302]|nr:hypothetical protein BDB13_6008 [Rhodococcus sp. OK302]